MNYSSSAVTAIQPGNDIRYASGTEDAADNPDSGTRDFIFEEMKMHYDDVLRIALLLCRDKDLALDLTQETFRNVFSAVENGSRVKNPGGYLVVSLRNTYMKYKQRIREFAGGSNPELMAEPVSDHVRMKSIHMITNQDIRDSLGTLPEKFRSILMLFYYSEYSYKQISDTLGIPQGTVMSRLSRARKALKEDLLEGKGL